MTSAWLAGRLRKSIGPVSLPSLSTRMTLRVSLPSPNASIASVRARHSGVRALGMIAAGSAASSSLAVARERRADRDLVAKRPQARHVFWQQPLEELDGGAAQQRQIALHAPGDVEHDDEPDRLRAVVELRERLRLAVVADLEVVAAECRHEPAVPVGHGDEDTDRVASRAEDLLCERRRTRCRKGQPHQRQAREPKRTANRAPRTANPRTANPRLMTIFIVRDRPRAPSPRRTARA